MKRLLPLVILAVALLGVALLRMQTRHEAPYPAPDFALPDLQGRVHRLSDYRGKVVFLNLWATWCPPCRMEMPSIERLYRRFAPEGLVVLAVSVDESGAKAVAPFVRELGITFPVLLDPEGRLGSRLGITGYPETFVIDRGGNVVRHFIGPAEWDEPPMAAYFAGLLAAPTPAALGEAGGVPSGSAPSSG